MTDTNIQLHLGVYGIMSGARRDPTAAPERVDVWPGCGNRGLFRVNHRLPGYRMQARGHYRQLLAAVTALETRTARCSRPTTKSESLGRSGAGTRRHGVSRGRAKRCAASAAGPKRPGQPRRNSWPRWRLASAGRAGAMAGRRPSPGIRTASSDDTWPASTDGDRATMQAGTVPPARV